MNDNKSLNYIIQLDKLFEEKEWKNKDNFKEVFESLSSFPDLIIKNDDEYDLILELLGRYQWITLNDYYNSCRDLLIRLINTLEIRNQNIYVFPIIKEKHVGNVKSGSFISYLIKSILPTIPNGFNLNFEDINTFESLREIRFKKNDKLILVDDFIGSGESLEECLKLISAAKKLENNQIKILSLAVIKQNIVKFESNFEVYYNFNVQKGITDFNIGKNIEEKKDIMKRIEGRIYFNIKQYSLGFAQSESLISLLRTPDNTFPIFWNKYKKSIKLIPPFPRNEKI